MSVELIRTKVSFTASPSFQSGDDIEKGNVNHDHQSAVASTKNEHVKTTSSHVTDPDGVPQEFSAKPPRRKTLSMIAEQTVLEKLVALFSLLVLASAIASLVMVGGTIIKASCIIMLLLSPYSYYQQTRITDIRALKETYAALTGEVNELEERNQELRYKVDNLHTVVDKLQDLEDVIEAISETQGKSVESLFETVQENEKIVQQLESNVRAVVLQNILSVVFSSDVDGDKKLSKEETNALIHNLSQINGVRINQGEFRKIVKENQGSIQGISKIIGKLLTTTSSTGSDEKSLFVFDSDGNV
jgi:hypothetical protein